MATNGVSPRLDVQLLSRLGKGAQRRWSILVMLLSLILLGASPWLYSLLESRIEDYQKFASLKSDPVYKMMSNPFGPDFNYERAEEILNCTTLGWPNPSPTEVQSNNSALPVKECPLYFRFIHKDLAPWKQRGITKRMVESSRSRFRVVILGGKLYLEPFYQCWESRAAQTVWGLLLLLEIYGRKVPDLEFMFNCEDVPTVPKAEHPAMGPPIVFGFDSNSDHFDVPIPDWSFWGWPELRIVPWDQKREAIVKGSERMEWDKKVPMAYWTGNVYVAPHRQELFKCHHANFTEIRHLDWADELRIGKEHSKLEDKCTHKYMIYTEGHGWSVSLKYIFACGSPVLALAPSLYDFFSRGLRQWVHYIPIRPSELAAPSICEAMDKAVEMGEANLTQAVEIGKAGQEFMRNDLSMENVYSYMFHLLRDYASLLKFEPVQGNAHLVTLDHVLCLKGEFERDILQQARAAMPRNPVPCQMAQITESNLEDDWQTQWPVL